MSDNNNSKITDQWTITSMEIAEVTGKARRNVLQSIRNMEPAWGKIKGLKFQLLHKHSQAGAHGHKMTPYYRLTKTECLFAQYS